MRKTPVLLISAHKKRQAIILPGAFNPLPNPTTAEISRTTSDEVEISACIVNAGCKIGYIHPSMRPHLQPVFPCLAGFFSVWQSVDFVNILKAPGNHLPGALVEAFT